MKEAQSLMAGVAIGAGMMFLLDPRQSGARRARIRDKSVRAVHELEHAASIGARDLEHRIEGVVATLQGGRRRVADGHVLEGRVRATLGRHCSHPHAIAVTAKGGGCIELRGPILASDVHDVLFAVSRVRGVEEIEDDLSVHQTAEDVPALQGEPVPRRRALNVPPAAKLVAAVGLAGIGLASVLRGRPAAFIGASAGVLALARSINTRSPTLLPKHRVRHPTIARREDEAPNPMMNF
jgi:hypothetical protein